MCVKQGEILFAIMLMSVEGIAHGTVLLENVSTIQL